MGQCPLYINIRDYGAVCDLTYDDTAAFNLALSVAANNGGGTVFCPSPGCLITGTLPITANYTHVLFERGSKVRFYPTQDCVLFDIGRPPQTLIDCSISGLQVWGYGTYKKTAIVIRDCKFVRVENVEVWSMTGNSSIGLLLQGRDQITVRNSVFTADKPLVIDKNPEYDVWNVLDLDMAHFVDLSLTAIDTSEPCVFITPTAYINQTQFDGFQAWSGGSCGLYWNNPDIDPEMWLVSKSIRIANVRYEATSDPSNWAIDINARIDNFTVENFTTGNFQNGFRFRNIYGLGVKNIYAGALQALPDTAVSVDINSTCKNIILQNCMELTHGSYNMPIRVMDGLTKVLDGGSTFEIWQPS